MKRSKSDYDIQTVMNALRVLEAFRDKEELGVTELSRRLGLHKNNVFRLLATLEDKGYVERDRTIAVHFFSAAISRQTCAGQQLESLADKLTAGSFTPLITHLVEEKKISRDEIKRIRAILDESGG